MGALYKKKLAMLRCKSPRFGTPTIYDLSNIIFNYVPHDDIYIKKNETAAGQELVVYWLNTRQSEWREGINITSDDSLRLVTPVDAGYDS